MRQLGNFLGGALLGGLVGGILMLLFTPYPGSVVRQKLDDYVHEITDEVREAARSRGEELRIQLDQLQGRAETKVE